MSGGFRIVSGTLVIESYIIIKSEFILSSFHNVSYF